MHINSLVILGGGTAGLISALMAKHSFPHLKVTVIESKEIGIIGVGEGSTEQWQTFMNHIDLNAQDLLMNTGATYKIGIKFTNWHGDNTAYWHSLAEWMGARDNRNGTYFMFQKFISEGYENEVSVSDTYKENRHTAPYDTETNQWHFDTNKLNSYFHHLAKYKGVIFEDDTVQDVILDNEGFVSSLVGKQGQKYEADFFIDCSGFRRVIASKLDTKWIDCKKQLPMNSAIAFPTGYEEDIPSYTESTALSSGWTWRIPTQERFGNGYVYCDDFISDDDAFKEVSMRHKETIEIGKKIKFGAGYVDKFWNKNCISMGLAGMFVEPLEATSIGSTIEQGFGFLTSIPYWSRHDTIQEKQYNKVFKEVAENIISFVQIHYITERRDSEFWRCVNNDLQLTEFNKEYLESFKQHMPSLNMFTNDFILFKCVNWTQVMWGLRMYNDRELIKQNYNKHFSYMNDWFEKEKAWRPKVALKHRECLAKIMKGEDCQHVNYDRSTDPNFN